MVGPENGGIVPNMHRLSKYLRCLTSPSIWPALAHRVLPTIEHGAPLAEFQFASVIDVGANKGQFAYFSLLQWPQTQLHCFEPLDSPRDQLRGLMAGRSCEIYDYALGATATTQPIHIADRDDSSSLLSIGENQIEIFHTVEQSSRMVEVRRLDETIRAEQLKGPTLLKIDVQGFELEVLKGGEGLFHAIDVIYTEASFIPLYDAQPLAGEIICFLEARGFRFVGLFNQVSVPGTGAISGGLSVCVAPDHRARLDGCQPRDLPKQEAKLETERARPPMDCQSRLFLKAARGLRLLAGRETKISAADVLARCRRGRPHAGRLGVPEPLKLHGILPEGLFDQCDCLFGHLGWNCLRLFEQHLSRSAS